MTLCYSKMFLLVLWLFGATVSIIEAAAYPAGSIEELQATKDCVSFSDRDGRRTVHCNHDFTCQLAIALTPAVLFCGNLGHPPSTTVKDYNPSLTCEGLSTCCGSAFPSAQKLEFNNGDTVWYGCGTSGGIFTAEADENIIITLNRSTTTTSTTEGAQTNFAAASPSPTISGPKNSSAPIAETSVASHSGTSPAKTSAAGHSGTSPANMSAASHEGSNSSGLNTASELGSVLGAVFGAIAIIVAIFYGTRTLKKWRPIHTNHKA